MEQDVAIDKYWSIVRELKPGELEWMRLYIDWNQQRQPSGGPLCLTIVLRPSDKHDGRRVILSFYGVMLFRFNPGSNVPYLDLDLARIEEFPWPELKRAEYRSMKYRVFESEQDNDISFLCADFDIIVVGAGHTTSC